MSELLVRDCMHDGVISCTPETSVEDVARTMREQKVSALVVVDGGAAIGVISQTDLVNAAFVQPYMQFWRGMAARHLMSSPVVSVRPDDRLASALDVLTTRRIHRVVVTEHSATGERPVGILSLTDVARALGTAAAAEIGGQQG